jgi:hypothetical protein
MSKLYIYIYMRRYSYSSTVCLWLTHWAAAHILPWQVKFCGVRQSEIIK